MDAPESIWIKKTIKEARQDLQSISDISELECKPSNSVISTFSEYVRKDIHDVAVSKARVDALKEAAALCEIVNKERIARAPKIRIPALWDELRDEILALIEKEPKP